MWDFPTDVVELVLRHLDLPLLVAARAVCSQWHEAASHSDTMIAASWNTKRLLTRTELRGLLGLSNSESVRLPCRPYVTRRGTTCWLYYPPDTVERGLALVKSRARENAQTDERHLQLIGLSHV